MQTRQPARCERDRHHARPVLHVFRRTHQREARRSLSERRFEVMKQHRDTCVCIEFCAIVRQRDDMQMRMRAQRTRSRIDHATHRVCGIGVAMRQWTQHLHGVSAVERAVNRCFVVEIAGHDFAADARQRFLLRRASHDGAHGVPFMSERRRCRTSYLARCAKNHIHRLSPLVPCESSVRGGASGNAHGRMTGSRSG